MSPIRDVRFEDSGIHRGIAEARHEEFSGESPLLPTLLDACDLGAGVLEAAILVLG